MYSSFHPIAFLAIKVLWDVGFKPHPIGVWRISYKFMKRSGYNIAGRRRKIGLYMDYPEALNMADDDINGNWQYYVDKFLRGEFP